MPIRRTFGHSLTSSEDKLFFFKKDMSSKKRTYGNPSISIKVAEMVLRPQTKKSNRYTVIGVRSILKLCVEYGQKKTIVRMRSAFGAQAFFVQLFD